MLILSLLTSLLFTTISSKICRPKAAGTKLQTITDNDINSVVFDESSKKTVRHAHQRVYFWPSLSDFEKDVLRDAFKQINRRTCIIFEEKEFKPWYHADRWDETMPYVIIRKSRNYAAYTDNKIEGLVGRTILYISENAFEQNSFNQSRGACMDQLVRYMGLRKELSRPDAPSYIQEINPSLAESPKVNFNTAQLAWPFDPESVTIPLTARKTHELTEYCPGRNNVDIGAGQRVGLLTKWDAIKLNTMFCPHTVVADPRRGPCVFPRKKNIDEFRAKLFAYKKLAAMKS